MLGRAIAARPLAAGGPGRLTSEFGRTRLAEAPLQVRGTADEQVESARGASAAREGTAAATRP